MLNDEDSRLDEYIKETLRSLLNSDSSDQEENETVSSSALNSEHPIHDSVINPSPLNINSISDDGNDSSMVSLPISPLQLQRQPQRSRPNFALPLNLPIAYSSSPSSRAFSAKENTNKPDDNLVGNTTMLLNDAEWEYLHSICSYMDNNLKAEISYPSFFNSQDAKTAASALGLPVPKDNCIQMLIEIGLDLFKYKDEVAPWCTALASKKAEADSRKQQQYLEQRRNDQEKLARKMNITRIQKKYMKYYRAALEQDVHSISYMARKYQEIRILPIYLAHWLSLMKVYSLAELLAAQNMHRRVVRASLHYMRMELHYQRGCEFEAVKIRDRILEKTYLNNWRGKVYVVVQLQRGTLALASKISLSKTVKTWTEKRRAEFANTLFTRILIKRYTNKFRQTLHDNRRTNELMVRFVKKKYITLWMGKYHFTDETKRINLENSGKIIGSLIRKRYFVYWWRESGILAFRRTTRNQVKRNLISIWRMNLKCTYVLSSRDSRLVYLHFHIWLESLRRFRNLDVRTLAIKTKENQAIGYISIEALQDELAALHLQKARASQIYYNILKKYALWRIILSSRKFMSRYDEATDRYQRLLLKRAYHSVIFAAETQRDDRLAQTLTRYERSMSSKGIRKIFILWKVKTDQRIKKFRQVSRFTEINGISSILNIFRLQRNTIALLNQQSVQRYELHLTLNGLKGWRDLFNMTELMWEAANDLNISRMAAIFKNKLRRWQHLLTLTSSQFLQAEKYNERQQRSVSLEYLQNWRSYAEEAKDDSDTRNTSSSLLFARSFSRDTPIPGGRPSTPRRKYPMTPQALQRWKANNHHKIHNSEFGNQYSILMPLSPLNQPSLLPIGRRDEDNSGTFTMSTPTKPARRGRAI